jgi:cytoskeletal protein CcmA (bactofilin family)
MVFSNRKANLTQSHVSSPERVTSVVGSGINFKGNISGKGGIRVEGVVDGEIAIQGLIVIGETGRVACEALKANTIIIAGAVKGDILAEKLEIRSTGRVWGDVVTGSFATEEGAFLRGKIKMEDKVELNLEDQQPVSDEENSVSDSEDV